MQCLKIFCFVSRLIACKTWSSRTWSNRSQIFWVWIAWNTGSSRAWSNWSQNFWFLITHGMKSILHESGKNFQSISETLSITYAMSFITHVIPKFSKIPYFIYCPSRAKFIFVTHATEHIVKNLRENTSFTHVTGFIFLNFLPLLSVAKRLES